MKIHRTLLVIASLFTLVSCEPIETRKPSTEKPTVKETVSSSPEKSGYKHSNKALKPYITSPVRRASGNKVSMNKLKGKYVAFYMSASWCPPCRKFTPILVKFRNKYKSKFEVIFISADRSQKDMITYMKDKKMPWGATDFKGTDTNTIRRAFSTGGIPNLVILGPDGKVVSRNGVSDVYSAKGFPWK